MSDTPTTYTESVPLPKWESDGFRTESCGACGQRIGYARFLASRINESAGQSITLFHHPQCPLSAQEVTQ